MLSEGLPYVERAPLVVLVPAGALILLSVLAVSLSSLTFDLRRTVRQRDASEVDAPHPTQNKERQIA